MVRDHSLAPRRTAFLLALAIFALYAGVIGQPAGASGPLVGTFRLAPGSDASGQVTGSYFRMIQPGGTADGGPFLSNADSGASDKTYTLLSPGTDGGLVTGAFQPEPAGGFDSGGNSLSNRIIDPTGFFGVRFGVNTNPVDLQTGIAVPAPTITVDAAGNLTGDLRAFGASWNNQEFNQGSPKPDGSTPGLTAGPTGSYDTATGGFTLGWTSLIVGGPFNSFTGKWHLTGRFVEAGAPPGGGTGGGSGAPGADAPRLVKVRTVRAARVRARAKRFVVDTGYRVTASRNGSATDVRVRATTSMRPATRTVVRRRLVARRTLSVAPGAAARVRLVLNRVGARLLRRQGRLRLRFRIRVRGAQPPTASGSITVKLRQ